MAFWIASVAGLAVAYFFGSIPTAYLAGKFLFDVDIREHGSGSVGATNALRVLGKWPALVVLLVDILKGIAAIVFVRWLCSWLFTHPFFAPTSALDQQTYPEEYNGDRFISLRSTRPDFGLNIDGHFATLEQAKAYVEGLADAWRGRIASTKMLLKQSRCLA